MSRPVGVLVEGASDAAVVRELAASRGLRGPEHGFEIVVLHGITNLGHLFAAADRAEPRPQVLGLCDAREQRVVQRVLGRRGIAVDDRDGLAEHGFFVCDRDLEDELLRAMGAAQVEESLDRLGELGRFRSFQGQPEWRDRALHDQLRRFAGTGSGRKLRLAEHLAPRLTPSTTPEPLGQLVDRIELLTRAGTPRG